MPDEDNKTSTTYSDSSRVVTTTSDACQREYTFEEFKALPEQLQAKLAGEGPT